MGISKEKYARVLRVQRDLASRLVEEHPKDIARDYREGLTPSQISRAYLPRSADKNIGIAESSVRKALQQVMDEEEYKKLAREHEVRGRKRGNGLTTEQRNDPQARKRRQENSRKALRARGFKPYDQVAETPEGEMKEGEYVLALYKKDGLSSKEIAALVNGIYYNNRDADNIRGYLTRQRKKGNVGRRRTPYSEEEDKLIVRLRNADLSWSELKERVNREIHEQQEARSKSALKHRYYDHLR
mgnify:CR=1 FL=1